METYNPIILGDKPKMFVKMSPLAGEYTLSSIEWSVTFYASRGELTIAKSAATKIDDDTYSVRVDTSKVGVGKLYGILYPRIPDSEVDEGFYVPPVPFDTGEEIVSPYNIVSYGLQNK